ncbi:MAG: hypothetical protein RL142_85 [Actinomycetota bacterium]
MTNKTNPASAGAIETNDVNPIPSGERHGKPWHLFTVWSSPNLEFATIFVGMLSVMYFGLDLMTAVFAIAVGNLLGVITHGWLSSWGPKLGVPQMVLGRSAFGARGNILPSALVTVTAGIGWFAVNSLSGAFALATMSGMDIGIALLIIAAAQIIIALIGHNFIHVFERYAFYVLAVVFAIVTVVVLANSNTSLDLNPDMPTLVGFTLTAGAAYGYTAGWTPFASDYTRYLPANSEPKQVALAAGSGMFLSTTLLMSVGAAFVTIVGPAVYDASNPTSLFAATLDAKGFSWITPILLLCIAVGSVSANVLNIYSGAISVLAMGLKLGVKTRRAIVALISGVVGTAVAYSVIEDLGHSFENFLLVVAYWVAPWIAIVSVDRLARNGKVEDVISDNKKNYNDAGVISLVVSVLLSIYFFANQVAYSGGFAKALGDLTPVAGFVTAAGLYLLLKPELAKNLSKKWSLTMILATAAFYIALVYLAGIAGLIYAAIAGAINLYFYISVRVAAAAAEKGRNERVFFWLSVVWSPAVTGLVIATIPSKK